MPMQASFVNRSYLSKQAYRELKREEQDILDILDDCDDDDVIKEIITNFFNLFKDELDQVFANSRFTYTYNCIQNKEYIKAINESTMIMYSFSHDREIFDLGNDLTVLAIQFYMEESDEDYIRPFVQREQIIKSLSHLFDICVPFFKGDSAETHLRYLLSNISSVL